MAPPPPPPGPRQSKGKKGPAPKGSEGKKGPVLLQQQAVAKEEPKKVDAGEPVRPRKDRAMPTVLISERRIKSAAR